MNDSAIGIICLTPENLYAPWIHFEVGALLNGAGKQRVCPYLFKVRKADVVMPLSHFQLTESNKDDTFKLIQTINLCDQKAAISDKVLTETFEVYWPKLENEIKKAPIGQPTKPLSGEKRATF